MFALFNFQSYSDAAQTRSDTPTGFNIWNEFYFFVLFLLSRRSSLSLNLCEDYQQMPQLRRSIHDFLASFERSTIGRGFRWEARVKKWDFAVFCTKLECLKFEQFSMAENSFDWAVRQLLISYNVMRRIKIDKIDENSRTNWSLLSLCSSTSLSFIIDSFHLQDVMRNLWKTEIRIPIENVIKIRIHHNKLHVTKSEDDERTHK